MTTTRGTGFFLTAAVCGLAHAAASAYWALGGTWPLDTVGEFAVQMQRGGGAEVRIMLGAVTLAKAAGAVVPLADHLRPPMHRWVRVLSWIGAVVLLLWGVGGMIGAWIGLAQGAVTTPAMGGHALLWDPLFVVWGGCLAAGLWVSRAGRSQHAGFPRPFILFCFRPVHPPQGDDARLPG